MNNLIVRIWAKLQNVSSRTIRLNGRDFCVARIWGSGSNPFKICILCVRFFRESSSILIYFLHTHYILCLKMYRTKLSEAHFLPKNHASSKGLFTDLNLGSKWTSLRFGTRNWLIWSGAICKDLSKLAKLCQNAHAATRLDAQRFNLRTRYVRLRKAEVHPVVWLRPKEMP